MQVDTPFPHSALHGPGPSWTARPQGCRGEGLLQAGVKKGFTKRNLQPGASSSAAGTTGTFGNIYSREAGDLVVAERPKGVGVQLRSKAGGEEALAACDGDFLCSQSPECHFWVN